MRTAPYIQPNKKKTNFTIPDQYNKTAFPPSHQAIKRVAVKKARDGLKIAEASPVTVATTATESNSRGKDKNNTLAINSYPPPSIDQKNQATGKSKNCR